MVRVADVARIIEEKYPLAYAVAGDNCGLQVGNPEDPVDAILVALDPSPSTVARAVAGGAGLLVTHHPLFYEPVRKIDPVDFTGAAAAGAIGGNLAVYAAHTNLDAAPGGLADALAAQAGLVESRPFPPAAGPASFKIAVFVPPRDVAAVHQAMAGAGAGVIGTYDRCAFVTAGEGYFRGLKGSKPAVGKRGKLERAAEVRIEMAVREEVLGEVIAAMKNTHPYEEVAFDIYRLAGRDRGGLGRIGAVGPKDMKALATDLTRKLGSGARLSGARRRAIRSVAVVPGSGGSLLRAAAGAGADVLVTGEIRYHQALEAEHLNIGVIEMGHDGSEMPAVDLLARTLRRALRVLKKKVKVATYKSPRSTRPIR